MAQSCSEEHSAHRCEMAIYFRCYDYGTEIEVIDLWLYPVVMDILTSGKSETGKSSLRPRSKISHQSPFLGASRLGRGDWLLIFDLGLREIFQSPISQR